MKLIKFVDHAGKVRESTPTEGSPTRMFTQLFLNALLSAEGAPAGHEFQDGDSIAVVVFRRRGEPLDGRQLRQIIKNLHERYNAVTTGTGEFFVPEGYVEAVRRKVMGMVQDGEGAR